MRSPAIAMCLFLSAVPLSAAEPDSATPANQSGNVGTITVEGKRDRAALEADADVFVSHVVAAPFQESLARWRSPVCPLVFGVPRDNGEYLLEKISQIARTVGVPLAGEHCRANFYIVLTPEPEQLLAAWSKRDRTLFGDAGLWQVSKVKQSTDAVRVWHNVSLTDADGSALTVGSAAMGMGGSADGVGAFNGIPQNNHATATRLAWNELRAMASAIVMVNTRKAVGVKYNQLTAYIAMLGFAQIRPNADAGRVPTILSLFSADSHAPPGLSEWDEALLKALYRTNQADRIQLSELRQSVVQSLSH